MFRKEMSFCRINWRKSFLKNHLQHKKFKLIVDFFTNFCWFLDSNFFYEKTWGENEVRAACSVGLIFASLNLLKQRPPRDRLSGEVSFLASAPAFSTRAACIYSCHWLKSREPQPFSPPRPLCKVTWSERPAVASLQMHICIRITIAARSNVFILFPYMLLEEKTISMNARIATNELLIDVTRKPPLIQSLDYIYKYF